MFVSLFFVTALSAQYGELKFAIVNNSGIDLYGVFLSESLDDNWGEDIIPGDVFDNESIVEVAIPINDETLCVYDIKITDHVGEGVIFPEIDFCEVSMITFFVGDDGEVYYKTE